MRPPVAIKDPPNHHTRWPPPCFDVFLSARAVAFPIGPYLDPSFFLLALRRTAKPLTVAHSCGPKANAKRQVINEKVQRPAMAESSPSSDPSSMAMDVGAALKTTRLTVFRKQYLSNGSVAALTSSAVA